MSSVQAYGKAYGDGTWASASASVEKKAENPKINEDTKLPSVAGKKSKLKKSTARKLKSINEKLEQISAVIAEKPAEEKSVASLNKVFKQYDENYKNALADTSDDSELRVKKASEVLDTFKAICPEFKSRPKKTALRREAPIFVPEETAALAAQKKIEQDNLIAHVKAMYFQDVFDRFYNQYYKKLAILSEKTNSLCDYEATRAWCLLIDFVHDHPEFESILLGKIEESTDLVQISTDLHITNENAESLNIEIMNHMKTMKKFVAKD